MRDELEDDIYATLTGQMLPEYRVPGVENAFAPGSHCDKQYQEMVACRQRVWDRLGVEDDEDVERIIMALEDIQEELCIRMFRLGQQFGKKL